MLCDAGVAGHVAGTGVGSRIHLGPAVGDVRWMPESTPEKTWVNARIHLAAGPAWPGNEGVIHLPCGPLRGVERGVERPIRLRRAGASARTRTGRDRGGMLFRGRR